MRPIPIVVAVLLAACQPSSPDATPPGTSSGVKAVRDSVIAGMREYEAAVRAMDSARVMSVIWEDSAFRYVEGQTPYTRTDFAKLAGEVFGAMASFDARFDYDALRIVELSPTSAVAIAPYVDVFTDRSGIATTVRGVVSWVWAVKGGHWRLASGHAAPMPPEAEK
jgi:uncharacterized protein (TIGR02246 family)